MRRLSIGWTIRVGRIIMRLWCRLTRQPSAARCHIHFVDLMKTPLRAIDTRVSITWEIAHDRVSVEDRVRELPVENWSDVGDRLAHNHRCLVGISDGVVAHAAWIGIGTFKAHWFDRWFRLQPGDAYLYGA